MAVEGLILIAIGGRRIAEVALLLLPGILFMLGLRAALTGADWRWVALPLALAFPAHLADVVGRRARKKRRS